MSAAVKFEPAFSLPALAASLALHGAVVVLALVLARQSGAQRSPAPGPDVWLGSSVEIETPTPGDIAAPATLAEAAPTPDRASAEETAPDPAPAEEAPPQPPEPELDSRAAEPTPPVASRSPASPPTKPKAAAARSRPSAPAAARASSSEATPGARPSANPSAEKSASAPDAASSASSPGSFGSTGLPPGVRRLAYAFARAIPMAAPNDSIWRELPAGSAGTIRIELEVDAEGHLGPARRWKSRPGEADAPPYLQRLVDRTLAFLRTGQFAISGRTGAGVERLVMEVQLSDGPSAPDAGETVIEKGQVEPLPGRPGAGYFRYGTGRRFDAKVTIVPAGRD